MRGFFYGPLLRLFNMPKPVKSTILRSLSLVMAALFFISDIAWAAPELSHLWPTAAPAIGLKDIASDPARLDLPF